MVLAWEEPNQVNSTGEEEENIGERTLKIKESNPEGGYLTDKNTD